MSEARPSYDDLAKSLGILAAEKVALEKKVAQLEDEAGRRRDWIWRMKSRLGYSDYISFDRVMEDLIAGKHLNSESKEGRNGD